MNDDILKRRLDRIERDQKKILALLSGEKASAKKWVKSTDLLKLTGWNRNQLRYRRNAGLIEFKKEGSSWLYNPDSLHPSLLIPHENQKNTATRSRGMAPISAELGETLNHLL